MKVEPAHIRRGREFVQRRRLVRGFDQAAGPGDRRRMLFGDSRLIRPAAFARPKSGALRLRARQMKGDILRRAGREAHEGRQYTPVVRTE